MPRRKGTTETIVGLFVLASIIVLFILVVLIGRRQNIFERRYEITGVFDAVGGLLPGAEVHLAGINVGFVKDIRFSSKNRVEVVMSISRSQMGRIRADSIATIRTMGVMGDRYVEITVGSEAEPVIAAGGTIKTAALIEIGEFLESTRPALRNLENTIKNISSLSDRLADPHGNVATILDNVKVVTTEIRQGQGTVGALLTRDDLYQKAVDVLETTQKTVDNFETVSSNTKEASESLKGVMVEAKTSIEEFGEFSTKAAEATAGISEIADSGREVMKDARVVAANLKDASEDIKNASAKVGPVIDSADEGVNEAKKVIEAAKRSWLIRGYFEPATPGQPIAISGRELAAPVTGSPPGPTTGSVTHPPAEPPTKPEVAR
ncbi:MCE family protein [Candidatus Poribacteria bacterium]|nr:MCE family protein [Candidatus Poribacteria bacterium]